MGVFTMYKYLGYTLFMTILLSIIILGIILWYYCQHNVKFTNCDLQKNCKPQPLPSKDTSNEVITIVSREDFVDKYIGGTDKKTKNLLENNLGKVLFIDEAYSLINRHDDPYGLEALNVLNRFLSEHPNEIVVIFAGYKELMQRTIFKMQPGLPRRCMWHFDCEPYSPEDLYLIFKKQLKNYKFIDEKAVKLLFQYNADAFPSAGGDTERLTHFVKIEHSKDLITNPKIQKNVLLTAHIERGIALLRENNIHKDLESHSTPDYNDPAVLNKMLELMTQ